MFTKSGTSHPYLLPEYLKIEGKCQTMFKHVVFTYLNMFENQKPFVREVWNLIFFKNHLGKFRKMCLVGPNLKTIIDLYRFE